ncbi:hypothetical protein Q0F99_06890 [Rathayibacter oskolensis]|uniref:hypothetical protein n=1 Tax=Rathayibacter oskolensis TaxID=1891671 RepID=UPI00265DC2FD|nr:hypothetical protein [Rathayibacter oskolensis]WKK72653.1 hypothetical protein Q0F99_06890 [Rathayibacter oskolensis]
MIDVRRRMTGVLGLAVLATFAVTACTTSPVDSGGEASAVSSATSAAAPAASEAPEPEPEQSAEDGFRDWLAASRAPDAASACAGLSPELAARMVAEMNDTGPLHVESCDAMITATAELYRATGQSAEVDIAVQQETATDATLFVTYLASGDCGTVVMTRPATSWIITEQSEECAA